MKHAFIFLLTLTVLAGKAQLYIQTGAAIHLQKHSELYIQGDVTGHNVISGMGTLHMIGDSVQSLSGSELNIPAIRIINKQILFITNLV